MNQQKDKKSLDELISHTIGGHVLEFDLNAWKEHHQHDIQQFKTRMKSRRRQSPTGVDAWRIIVRSRIMKLAAAAMIIAAALIGLTYRLPTGGPTPGEEMEIEIPPELAQMPIDKLLDIHFGKAESPYESSMVAAAVARALDKLLPREVLDVGRKYSHKSEFPQAEREAYYPPAVSAVVEASDFVVLAHVDDVTLDVSDIKEAILNPPPAGIDMPGRVKVTVDLRVMDAYPSLPAEFAEKIRLWPVLTTESLDMFEEGKEYMIALQQDGDIIWHLLGWEGVYPIDPNSQTVSGSGFRYTSMTLEETWQLIMDSYDAIHKGIQPSEETLDFWLEKLQSENFTDCWSAVEYFSTLREPPVPPELLVDAVEKQLSIGYTDDESEKYQLQAFIIEAIDLFDTVPDEPTTEKLLDLYSKEASSPESILRAERVRFNHLSYRETHSPVASVARLALKHPGPKRHERFMQLASCQPLPNLLDRSILVEELGRTEGEDIDRLIMQMMQYPATFGIDDSSELSGSLREIELRGRLWEITARRKLAEFGDYLEQFLAGPNHSDLTEFNNYKPERLEQAIESAENLFNTYYATQAQRENWRKRRLQDLVDKYRNGESVIRHGENWTVHAISEIIKPEDTEFLDVLVQAANELQRWRIHDIAATMADPCFVPIVRKALEQDVTRELLEALYACGARQEAIEKAVAELEKTANWEIIEFLGTTGDTSVLPLVEDFTREDVIDVYRDESWHSFEAPHLQRSAVLALARLGGESAIPRLKKLYESEDTDFVVRIAAALSLYSLGDDTGYELLEHFVNGMEHSIVEFEERVGGDIGNNEAFYPIATYLRSPRGDTLLLEYLRRTGYAHFGTSFFRDHEREILPILVDNLQSKDRASRSRANDVLKKVTGRDFGFQPGRFVGQQQEAVERWSSYVEQYLTESGDSGK